MKMIYLFLLLVSPVLHQGSPSTQINTISLFDLKGQSVSLHKYVGRSATIILFISPECPLCQSYTLTINKLIASYQNDSIRFLGVVPGKQFSADEILSFKRKYKLNLTILKDPVNQLTHFLKASITPEAFMLNKHHQIIYQGRIDNWAHDVGKKRAVITKHDLTDAIRAFQQHQPIPTPKTQAIGCFIE